MLLILAAFLLLPFGAKAENSGSGTDWPVVFPTEDAEWEYGVKRDTYFGRYDDVHYRLDGNIVIDGKIYSKLLYVDKNDCVGGIRVEGNNVYFRPEKYKGDTEEFKYEYLLYYFPNAAGEIVEIPNAPYSHNEEEGGFDAKRSGGSFSVEDVKVNSGVKTVSVYYLDSYDHYFQSDKWIEGIGGIRGFWQGRAPMTTGYDDVFFYLKSFTYKGKQLYPIIIDGVEHAEAENRLFVTVASNEIKISGYSDIVLPFNLSLVDKVGVIVKEFEITDLNTSLSADGMPSGIYIFRLSGAGINQTGKLIIR